jgi:hypothetical protein
LARPVSEHILGSRTFKRDCAASEFGRRETFFAFRRQAKLLTANRREHRSDNEILSSDLERSVAFAFSKVQDRVSVNDAFPDARNAHLRDLARRRAKALRKSVREMVFRRSANLWIIAIIHAFGNSYIAGTFGTVR